MGVEGKLHFHRGVYDETVKSTYGVKVRPASAMEKIRLSAQPEYVYFLPYIPLALCPDLPDPAAEFVYARNIQMEVVCWDLDYELVPSLTTSDRTTAKIFGILKPLGLEFINFASGFILEDVNSRLAVRTVIESARIIEPTISRSSSREKLLSTTLDLFVIGIQSPSATFTLLPDRQLKHLRMVRQADRGDVALWKVMNQFWKQESIQL